MLESELFALLQRTTDAAFSVTEEGEIMSWNKGAEKLFGYPAAEAVHKTCYEIWRVWDLWAHVYAISIAVWPNALVEVRTSRTST